MLACATASLCDAAELDLAQRSSAVVEATVLETAVVLQPEPEPMVAEELPPGTPHITPLFGGQTLIGAMYRIRVDEVLEEVGLVAVGAVLEIYDPFHDTCHPEWSPNVDQRWVLSLRPHVPSVPARREIDPLVHRRRMTPEMSYSDEVVSLDDVYRIVDPHRGGAAVVGAIPNQAPSVTGGRTWSGAGWSCRTAHAVKTDPDGNPLTCRWYVGNSTAGECRRCGGCEWGDDTCAGSNDPAVPQESCEISMTCWDTWNVPDSETWTINRF